MCKFFSAVSFRGFNFSLSLKRVFSVVVVVVVVIDQVGFGYDPELVLAAI